MGSWTGISGFGFRVWGLYRLLTLNPKLIGVSAGGRGGGVNRVVATVHFIGSGLGFRFRFGGLWVWGLVFRIRF